MMKRFFAGFLFFLFVMEGSVFQLLLPQAWGSSFVIIPQLVVSGIVVLSLYLKEQQAVLFGVGFGFLHDIVYGPALGIFAFSTGLTAWGTVHISRLFPPYPWIAGLIAILAQLSHLLLIYGWYRLFDFTQMPFFPSLFAHILPSVFFNIVWGFPIYQFMSWIYNKNKRNTIQLFGS
ncbi:rod shape-determining protein MreD [Paenactinomyces guangxiensis]|uniref:Rod shape-determining protein MreD n=1 Tax=Paenactinomyces guangxiensis TaxID=1490290 RepID=A0A7W2A913_9BACL|nr:rod shape-determining protein MreD [Paenactinomyces guangxiensis]MBA4496156.1 rod shape-determining protein MreD [Paenactinomyces guangxiensis]MBH8593244.1 rod shape-determining protein MreD [Paenactinomyces guangxiensis]